MHSAAYTILVTLPFSVCFLWSVILFVEKEKLDKAKKSLLLFSSVCTVLYLCHALNYLGAGAKWVDSVWITCSTAVFPLFWLYIRNLTESSYIGTRDYWVVIPSLLIGAASLFTDVDTAGKIIMVTAVALICSSGYKRLKRYESKVNNFYSDTENRNPRPLLLLMILMVIASFGASALSIIGRDFFKESDIVMIPAVVFTVVLFSIFLVGYRLKFTAQELYAPEEAPKKEENRNQLRDNAMMERIEKLMNGQEYFKRCGLTIAELAAEIGSNKSYVSSCINSRTGKTFNEYVNGLRVEEAKRLILERKDGTPLSEIGESCGFSNEASFYRIFKAYTGMTPSNWRSTQL